MRLDNLHVLPKVRDRLSYLYVEHARVDQEAKAIAIHNADGVTPVPCASLALLLLGPGTRITHAAVLALADNGCTVVWCGEEGVRFYAAGTGVTRHAGRLLHQAALCARKSTRIKVVRRMYELRFEERLEPGLSLQQIRGLEGVRVRDAYARLSLGTGVPWHGRSYQRGDWRQADPVNRALSTANACLYGVCHAAIVAAGYSPAMGFIHTGKQLSFVYDVADLYKTDISIPAAFRAAADHKNDLERRVRLYCRDCFAASRLLERVVSDIDTVLQVPPDPEDLPEDFDVDPSRPGDLWDPDQGYIEGGMNYADASTQSAVDSGPLSTSQTPEHVDHSGPARESEQPSAPPRSDEDDSSAESDEWLF